MATERYDYVIVGAGSSGSALAARLSENGRHSVAVLEAGKEQRPKTTAIPAALVRTIGDKRYDWQYLSQPDPTRNGRLEPWPRGRGPGGSGLINGMIFVRGAPADYDAWRELGATGWGYSDVLPNFKRMESVHGIEGALRGQSGPQSVSALRYVHPVTRLFVESARNAGIPFTPDYNGAIQDGVGFVQAAQRAGRRHSPFDAFLQPAVAAGRVRLIQEARVQRVVFEGRAARGVAYLAPDGSTHVVEANKLVVLSAGSINTPQLLMLSGVGPGGELTKLGIAPKFDAPEVGANLMEHAGAWMRASLDVPTLNSHATPARKALALMRWVGGGGGPATTPTAQSVAFVRTQDGLDSPDIQIHFAAFGFTGPAQTDPRQQLVMVVPSVNHPESRGAIKLASSDPQDAPLILPRLLDSARDMATMRRGVRLCRAILEARPMSRHLVQLLESPPEDDEALDAFIRAASGPLYHPVGTCRMGSDERSVVRPDLMVRGVDKLAVADVSIMPRHISGNTHAAALMIGDKAADLFRSIP
jgi:choline dehydrogenase